MTAGEDEAVKFFQDWHQMILDTVPADKLLIYNVQDGWEPLVKFLGKEIPDDKPFPDINDGTTITVIVLSGYYFLIIILPAFIIFVLWKRSSRFRNTVHRIFSFTIGAPITGCYRLFKFKFRKSNTSINKGIVNNNYLIEKKNDYVQYSKVDIMP